MSQTALFIHGAWLTPTSWVPFTDEFTSRGFACIAPAWPYMDRPVEELRRSPAPELNHLGIAEIADHYAGIVRELEAPPILIGHSFGGLIVQLLLDRGLGAAGVAIDPGAPRGVLARPGAIVTSFPVLGRWRGWRQIHTMSEQAFTKGFANGLSPAEQRAAYRSQIVPAPGRIFFEAAFGIANAVRYDNPQRPPLLLMAGTEDRTVPIGMVRANYAKAKRAPTPTTLIDLPGRGHFVMAQDGWREVAQTIIDWTRTVGATSASAVAPTPLRAAVAAAS